MLAFRELLRGVIAMPGRRMADGRTPELFDRFAAASQRLGVYCGNPRAALSYCPSITPRGASRSAS